MKGKRHYRGFKVFEPWFSPKAGWRAGWRMSCIWKTGFVFS